MEIRQAILAAAAHIEANPGEFRFSSVRTPTHPGCGTPGCAIGWIASFLGVEFRDALIPMVGHRETGAGNVFYDRMTALRYFWQYDAADCARALRLYADRWHPAAPIVYPNWQAMASTRTVGADEPADAVRAS